MQGNPLLYMLYMWYYLSCPSHTLSKNLSENFLMLFDGNFENLIMSCLGNSFGFWNVEQKIDNISCKPIWFSELPKGWFPWTWYKWFLSVEPETSHENSQMCPPNKHTPPKEQIWWVFNVISDEGIRICHINHDLQKYWITIL